MFTENSRRAFFKEFQKVVEAADVVIQVLDARDPLGSRCLDVERLVLKSGATKRIILLLNKIGILPYPETSSSDTKHSAFYACVVTYCSCDRADPQTVWLYTCDWNLLIVVTLQIWFPKRWPRNG